MTLHTLARAWLDSIEARRPRRAFPPFSRPGRDYGWTMGGDGSFAVDETREAQWLYRMTRPDGRTDAAITRTYGGAE